MDGRTTRAKQICTKTMFTTGEIVSLAEWIIHDTCLVNFILQTLGRFHERHQPRHVYHHPHEDDVEQHHYETWSGGEDSFTHMVQQGNNRNGRHHHEGLSQRDSGNKSSTR